jgi:hypothetical protein
MPTPPYNTPNKNLIVPAHGSDTGAWDVPVNSDWAAIDNAFGGSSSVALASSNVVLTVAQYQPPNITLTGALSANVIVYFPAGTGGLWSIFNNTTGAFTVSLANDTPGGVVVLPQGQRTVVISDGTNVAVAQSGTIGANPSALVGLSMVPGVAGTYMRSDAAPPLDQSISPNWSGNHAFNALAAFNSLAQIWDILTIEPGAQFDARSGSALVATLGAGNSSQFAASTAFVAAAVAGLASAASVTAAINAAINAGQSHFGILTGYDVMPSGRIEMWGIGGTSTGVASTNILFSATGYPGGAFPTGCDNVQMTNANNTQELFYTISGTPSATGFTANATNLGGGSFQWRATGH